MERITLSYIYRKNVCVEYSQCYTIVCNSCVFRDFNSKRNMHVPISGSSSEALVSIYTWIGDFICRKPQSSNKVELGLKVSTCTYYYSKSSFAMAPLASLALCWMSDSTF